MNNYITDIAIEALEYIATYPVISLECVHQLKDIAIDTLQEITEEQSPTHITAENVLESAGNHIIERGNTYDSQGGERSMSATVEAFNIITGHELKESQGWLFMALLKAVRGYQKQKYHADSFEDMAAYVALAAEAKAREGK